MRKIFLPILILTSLNVVVIAQNKAYLSIQTGISTLYLTKGNVSFGTENTYLNGYLYWDKNKNFANSIGITYESKTFSILGSKYFIKTEGLLSHRGYYDREFLNFLIISNDLYFPVKEKTNRLRVNFGIRNSLTLVNIVDKANNDIIERQSYFYGGLMFLNYKLSNRYSVGLKIYSDFSEIAGEYQTPKHWTSEVMFYLGYKI